MFTLVRIQKGVRVYPGIKDLPAHIRPNFRNEFIRYAIKQVANSEVPWTNPDVDSIQSMYQIVYPTFPAKIRHSDAVYHPVSNLLPPPLQILMVSQDHLIARGAPQPPCFCRYLSRSKTPFQCVPQEEA